jgi:hypothetical protein
MHEATGEGECLHTVGETDGAEGTSGGQGGRVAKIWKWYLVIF